MVRRRDPSTWLTFIACACAALFALPGCQQGNEGDRCNAALDSVGSDECNSGLTCQQPASCVITVCCPSAPPYSDPQCACFAHPGPGCPCYEADGGYDAGLSVKEAGHE